MATGGGGDGINLSEECVDICCTTCSKNNLNNQAISYCTDCNKYVCRKCLLMHNVFLDGHKLVDANDTDPGSVLTEKCDKHKGEVIKFFCVDHDDAVCSECVIREHIKCHELKPITDSIDDLKLDLKTEAVPDQLKSALNDIEQVITSIDRHLGKLSEREGKFLEEIKAYANTIMAKIEEMKANAEKKVTTKHEQLASSAIEKRQTCLKIKEDIIKKLERIETSKSRKSDLFVLMKNGETLSKKVARLCRESEDLMKGSRLVFRLDRRVENCLKEFISLGTVKEKYKVTLKGHADVSVKGDRTVACGIEGCCLLRDGTVLLVDDENKRIKHIDPSTSTIKDHCELKGNLMGIAQLSPDEVAVGNWSPDLQIVSLGSKLTYESTLRLNHKCRRLVMSRGELFATDGDTVYVYDKTVKLQRTICKDKSGQKMFSNIYGIVVGSTGDSVFVADWDKGLVCVDRVGREIFRRPSQELGLSTASDVCIDGAGNVFVCGWSSNNVIQVSEDGRVKGAILSESHGIHKPRCLCFDPKIHTLYVGGEKSKMLNMFKIH